MTRPGDRPGDPQGEALGTPPENPPGAPAATRDMMEPAPPASRRPLRTLWRPTARRAQIAVALLCALFGFALVVQVRTAAPDNGRATARQEDLARILDDLGARSDRLRSEIDALRTTRDRLANGDDRGRLALQETQRRAEQLGILAGTLPAYGPGITVTITDPRGTVRADVLLDAVEELRDAGAEALEIDGVRPDGAGPAAARIVASTALLDATGGVTVGGTGLRPPYRFRAIGDAATLAAAMAIPGGVVDTVAAHPGAGAVVASSTAVAVTALHRLAAPRYAAPAPTARAG